MKEHMEIPGGQLSREPLIIRFVHGRTSYDVYWGGEAQRRVRSKVVHDVLSLSSIKKTKKFSAYRLDIYQGNKTFSYTFTVCSVLYNQVCSLNRKTGTNMYTFMNRVHV